MALPRRRTVDIATVVTARWRRGPYYPFDSALAGCVCRIIHMGESPLQRVAPTKPYSGLNLQQRSGVSSMFRVTRVTVPSASC